MGVVMKGRERMWVEDIHCKGMGVVMKGREKMWVKDIHSSSFGIQLSIHWMITSCCECVGIRNNNKFSQFITYLQVVPIGTNFVVKTIYNFIFI
jgi:hypothetical protein